MCAAAQFLAGADGEHAHGLAVLLAKQHHGAGFLRAVQVHDRRIGRGVGQNFFVHPALDLGDLLGRDGRVVREVEARLLGIDERALLLHVRAQHLAQRLVHQVRDAVVAHGGGARGLIDARVHTVAHLERALRHHAVVTIDVGLDFLRVFDAEDHAFGQQLALVADLTAAFRIERRGVEHDDAAFTLLQVARARPINVDSYYFASVRQFVVTGEDVGRAAVFQRLVHLELARRAASGFLTLHCSIKCSHINLQVPLATNVLRQIERKPVGVVQLERRFTRKGSFLRNCMPLNIRRRIFYGIGSDLRSGRFQDLHAVGQRFVKALFLRLQHLFHPLRLRLQTRIRRAHQFDQRRHQLVEEGLLLSQFVAMPDRAADDAALHVAAAFVRWNHTIADEERRRADVVGNHLQRGVGQVCAARDLARLGNQLLEQVDLVVAVHVLQDGGQALQAHAGVDAGRGQLGQAAVLVHLELHEHVVPDLDEAVAVLIGRSGRAAGDVRAVVVEDFRARAAGAGVGHHPEVVALVAPALVVADADHALGRQADDLGPDVVSLVVLLIDGGQQLVRLQSIDLGEQLPAPFDALLLEVVAEGPVAQHLEEGVVARGVAHVFQIVVLAARAQAGLHAGRAHVGALVGAEEHVLELHHAAVGEHERRVVAGHQRAARHHGVALAFKEVEEGLADVGDGHGKLVAFHGLFGV